MGQGQGHGGYSDSDLKATPPSTTGGRGRGDSSVLDNYAPLTVGRRPPVGEGGGGLGRGGSGRGYGGGAFA